MHGLLSFCDHRDPADRQSRGMHPPLDAREQTSAIGGVWMPLSRRSPLRGWTAAAPITPMNALLMVRHGSRELAPTGRHRDRLAHAAGCAAARWIASTCVG